MGGSNSIRSFGRRKRQRTRRLPARHLSEIRQDVTSHLLSQIRAALSSQPISSDGSWAHKSPATLSNHRHGDEDHFTFLIWKLGTRDGNFPNIPISYTQFKWYIQIKHKDVLLITLDTWHTHNTHLEGETEFLHMNPNYFCTQSGNQRKPSPNEAIQHLKVFKRKDCTWTLSNKRGIFFASFPHHPWCYRGILFYSLIQDYSFHHLPPAQINLALCDNTVQQFLFSLISNSYCFLS